MRRSIPKTMLSSQWAFVKTLQMMHQFMNIIQLKVIVFTQKQSRNGAKNILSNQTHVTTLWQYLKFCEMHGSEFNGRTIFKASIYTHFESDKAWYETHMANSQI